ncbi:MAG: tyrosine-type recombinase/integrase [Kiritimatiellia bacterium]
MTPDEAIALYLYDCRNRHLSDASIRSTAIYLGHFAKFCDHNHLDDLRNATAKTLQDFLKWTKMQKGPNKEPWGVKYQHRHVREVKQLFRLLYKRGLIMSDITATLEPLRDPLTLPRGIMDKDQVMKLLQQPLMTTPIGFRDRTMLEVLYSTGLRGGELCRLTLYNLDLQARMIRVLGKGRKERVVPVGKVATGYLGEYLKAVRPILLGKHTTAVVFLTATGLPLRTHDLGRIVKMYRDKAHLPDNITTHSLRHTCATEMLKGGASIRHVQELLGHADIATTQIYTHVVQTDLQKAHARTAPSEQRKNVDVPSFDHDVPRWNDNRNAKYWPQVRGPAAVKRAEEQKNKPDGRRRKKARKKPKK